MRLNETFDPRRYPVAHYASCWEQRTRQLRNAIGLTRNLSAWCLNSLSYHNASLLRNLRMEMLYSG
ncbi:hypothetical protein M378DRAFT_458058 [Amanita muscaria Koide BX008]|uniref:Uncharacterized protein n=1 Tax=Amanita muscaria (strain Koide BX008) TaxID=946122 RepID=A0A0C2TFR6_AMAMK|nr:hypothetical protein M378DRAFT_458058 [Amanita muscaria Koide BX008]